MSGRAHRFSHEAMATVFEVHCHHEDARYAGQAARAAFDLVDRLEQELSRFVANSDVSRINGLAAGERTRVSPSTLECLDTAFRMHVATGGAFDVSLGSGLERLDLVEDECVVVAREAGARLDLGGIGKGHAVDRMAELLDEWGIASALLHGGFSSVLALEAPPGEEGWPLTLSLPGPGEPRILARVSARQRAFSASGTLKGDHVRDPHTGRAVQGRAAWVALGRSGDGGARAGAVAEALSTAFMILPAERAADLCRGFPDLEAWLAGDSVVHLVGPAVGA